VGIAYPPGVLAFIPGFGGVRVARSLIFGIMFCQSMASMNYFDSKRKNPTDVLKQKSVMERHVITKSTNIHDYSCFCLFLLCVGYKNTPVLFLSIFTEQH
jgi:hypothetical protein